MGAEEADTVPTAETKLTGGNSSTVWRSGDVMLKPAGDWTPSVHAVLRHLRESEFPYSPIPLGIDDRGREMLRFVEGDSYDYPLPRFAWSERTLAAAGQLLHEFHEATSDFVIPPDARWMLPLPPPPYEVMCHNDFAPYNLVFREQQIAGLIDYDTMTPGPRIWDIAYGAYRFVPLSANEGPSELHTLAAQIPRLHVFLEAYGFDGDPSEVVATAIARVGVLVRVLRERVRGGDPVALRHVADGDADLYDRDIAYLESNLAAFRGERRRKS